MYFLYSVLMYLLSPFMVLRLWWKGRKVPGYRQAIPERFGFYRHEGTVDIWVHAVSLGEVIAATPLIDALLKEGKKLLITAMTPTGRAQITSRFGERVYASYAPYDLPFSVSRFYRHFQPKTALIMETEIWPNLIVQAKSQNIRLYLVNARLSPYSFHAYERLRFFFGPLLNQFQKILAQSFEDAERFKRLGAEERVIEVAGNIKFDCAIHPVSSEICNEFQSRWGSERTVVIAASTHEDEEVQILSHWHELKKEIPDALLLIAPRHPDRFQKVYECAVKMGFRTNLRSAIDDVTSNTEVLVIDALGQLLLFYQMSHYAFVGGSLVPKGGHNVLEPIALDIPVFTGPHLENFQAITNALKEKNGMICVPSAAHLMKAICAMHADRDQKMLIKENAAFVFKTNQGAIQNCLKEVLS